MLIYAKAWQSTVLLLQLYSQNINLENTSLPWLHSHLSNFIFSVELSLYFAMSCSFNFLVISLKIKFTRQLDYSVE